MTALDTVIDRLEHDGYDHRFRPEEGGMRCTNDNWLYRPDDLRIEHIVQVESDVDPDGGGVVLAVRSCLHGTAGVCVVPLDEPVTGRAAHNLRAMRHARQPIKPAH